jgi:hypothetical protein
MAVVTAPLMSAEARGRVGGVVHGTWRGRSYVKAKTGPAQPRTALQLTLRSIAITVARGWQSLSATNQALWNDYAAAHTETNWTGNAIRLTGANWYTRLGTRLVRLGNATVDAPPTSPAPPGPDSVAVSASGQKVVVTWSDPGTPATNADIWLSGPHSAGQQPRFPKARYLASVAMTAETYSSPDVPNGTYDLWIRAIDTANGLVSLFQVGSTTLS